VSNYIIHVSLDKIVVAEHIYDKPT